MNECWTTVEIGDANLQNQANATIEADPERLRQLFENFFRNAAEHAGENVTVTVGDLDDGFYVEDDGPGIDADAHDKIFESGYTTKEDGTGLGLSIVREIVDAHNWTIHVTNSTDGGARFEITDVDITAE